MPFALKTSWPVSSTATRVSISVCYSVPSQNWRAMGFRMATTLADRLAPVLAMTT
ncbi:hypothetical protein [Microbulbifer hainanensis]|uniref:hypothetical protein n=1 Tax=Microbulbifer hainanensis TaxID=2735675 RepID=UPI001D026C00|nr:hypothetical protein [Microbulbifer hainanensis]